MRMTEPTQYLPFVNQRRQSTLTVNDRVECAVCPNTFRIKDGAAFAATCNGEPIVGLFCSEVCYLAAIPLQSCGRA